MPKARLLDRRAVAGFAPPIKRAAVSLTSADGPRCPMIIAHRLAGKSTMSAFMGCFFCVSARRRANRSVPVAKRLGVG